MFYFYVLKSLKDKDLYSGFTNDLRQRFKDHNAGKVKSTKQRKPFNVVYYESYKSEEDARNRERQIKRRAKAFIGLKRRLKYSLL